MCASPSQPTTTARTPIKAVLIAGAGEIGRTGARELLARLAPLLCPIIVCIRDADLGSFDDDIDGTRTRWVVEGADIEAAAIWFAPPNRHTFVRDGRFFLSKDDSTFPADAPSLGKLYHSLRLGYGSRVFAIVIDTERIDTPELRLLSQRGARVVTPIDCGERAVATYWSSDEIAEHLGTTLAAPTEVAVA